MLEGQYSNHALWLTQMPIATNTLKKRTLLSKTSAVEYLTICYKAKPIFCLKHDVELTPKACPSSVWRSCCKDPQQNRTQSQNPLWVKHQDPSVTPHSASQGFPRHNNRHKFNLKPPHLTQFDTTTNHPTQNKIKKTLKTHMNFNYLKNPHVHRLPPEHGDIRNIHNLPDLSKQQNYKLPSDENNTTFT